MNELEFHLYRIKMIRPMQSSLLHDDKSPADLFFNAIQERPSLPIRKDLAWHIGNLERIDKDGGQFAVGKTTKTTFAKYDSNTRNFREEHLEESPYTLCLYDTRIGFIAIAKKSKLAPTTKGIANKIRNLLQKIK